MKKYDDNIPLLKNRVETHAFIRNISKHRLPDGTLDVEGNLKLWSDARLCQNSSLGENPWLARRYSLTR